MWHIQLGAGLKLNILLFFVFNFLVKNLLPAEQLRNSSAILWHKSV